MSIKTLFAASTCRGSISIRDPHMNGREARQMAGLSVFFSISVQTTRSTIIFLISAMAAAGFSPFGQVLAQFMIVWQR